MKLTSTGEVSDFTDTSFVSQLARAESVHDTPTLTLCNRGQTSTLGGPSQDLSLDGETGRVETSRQQLTEEDMPADFTQFRYDPSTLKKGGDLIR
jgi:hypothetical protein